MQAGGVGRRNRNLTTARRLCNGAPQADICGSFDFGEDAAKKASCKDGCYLEDLGVLGVESCAVYVQDTFGANAKDFTACQVGVMAA